MATNAHNTIGAAHQGLEKVAFVVAFPVRAKPEIDQTPLDSGDARLQILGISDPREHFEASKLGCFTVWLTDPPHITGKGSE